MLKTIFHSRASFHWHTMKFGTRIVNPTDGSRWYHKRSFFHVGRLNGDGLNACCYFRPMKRSFNRNRNHNHSLPSSSMETQSINQPVNHQLPAFYFLKIHSHHIHTRPSRTSHTSLKNEKQNIPIPKTMLQEPT